MPPPPPTPPDGTRPLPPQRPGPTNSSQPPQRPGPADPSQPPQRPGPAGFPQLPWSPGSANFPQIPQFPGPANFPQPATNDATPLPPQASPTTQAPTVDVVPQSVVNDATSPPAQPTMNDVSPSATTQMPPQSPMSATTQMPSFPFNFSMPSFDFSMNIDTTLQMIGGFFMSTFKDETHELTTLMLGPFDAKTIPCSRDAIILTKSSTIAPNGACPSQWSKLSCTCVKQTNAPTTHEWIFRVTSIDSTTDKLPAEVEASTSILHVNTLGQFNLQPSITTFRLFGMTETQPLTIGFDTNVPKLGDSGFSLISSGTTNVIEQVEVANINLTSLTISDSFVPSSVTHVTLRNCGLKQLPSPNILMRWTKLVSLDLSANQFSTWYTTNDQPPSTFTTLNLAANAFTSIPSSLVAMSSLQSLNFSYNPVTNFNVSASLFDYLSNLKTVTFKGINSSFVTPTICSANQRKWKSAHGINFCVASPDSSVGAASVTDKTPSSHHSPLVQYLAIGGALAVVAMVIGFILVRRQRRATRPFKTTNNTGDAFEFGKPSAFATINSRREESDNTPILQAPALPIHVDPTLLNHSLIVSSRLDHNEVRLGELLKQGGFGVVFSGVYRRRRVAIKTLRRENAGNRKNLEAFLREIALMATLEHPRVVEYIGCAWDSIQNLAVIVELMDRGDLREVLQNFSNRNAQLTWASHKTRFALHIAEGLQYLHTLSPKVIHRDLKSKNVLVNTNLDAKLTDFGISREGRFEQTHMTAGIGTSFWIAPEVLAGLKYDERADIYSFGVVLSEIDTNDYPYWNDPDVTGDADDSQRVDLILRKVLAGTMRPRFTSECPEIIRILADQCLETEPSKRPSATEIVEYLVKIVHAPLDLRRQYLELKVT